LPGVDSHIIDEVIKISAHRLGTIEIESALLRNYKVVESAFVGCPDRKRGETACAFVVLKGREAPDEDLMSDLRRLIKTSLGPIAVLSDIYFVTKLPKLSSGNIMRRVIKGIVNNMPLGDYSTIEDGTATDELRKAAKQ